MQESLSFEEEKELFKKYKDGDEKAKEKIILSNLKLVVSIAKKYMKKSAAFIDLIQEGNLGLVKAIEKFDISKNCCFSTYAYYWIKQEILRYLANTSKTIRVPVFVYDKINKVKKAQSIFFSNNGKMPTKEELSEILNISVEEVQDLLVIIFKNNITSLDAPASLDSDTDLIDFIMDDVDGPEELIIKTQYNSYIQKLINISNLSQREIDIIYLKFGIETQTPKTLSEIAEMYGFSRQRVYQIIKKSLDKIRISIKEEQRPKKDIDSITLLEFEMCDDLNKFDPSRIKPKFKDSKTSMGTWFIDNMPILLQSDDKKYEIVKKQYKQFKNMNNKNV